MRKFILFVGTVCVFVTNAEIHIICWDSVCVRDKCRHSYYLLGQCVWVYLTYHSLYTSTDWLLGPNKYKGTTSLLYSCGKFAYFEIRWGKSIRQIFSTWDETELGLARRIHIRSIRSIQLLSLFNSLRPSVFSLSNSVQMLLNSKMYETQFKLTTMRHSYCAVMDNSETTSALSTTTQSAWHSTGQR